MQLALECLRQRNVIAAVCDGQAALVLAAQNNAMADALLDAEAESTDDRVWRARCALYLRAALRADREDFGRVWCRACGRHYAGGCECWDKGRVMGEHFTCETFPLWRLAPPHTKEPAT
jgi:hypothetical protein